MLKTDADTKEGAVRRNNELGLDVWGLRWLWDFYLNLPHFQPPYLICPKLQNCGGLQKPASASPNKAGLQVAVKEERQVVEGRREAEKGCWWRQ